MPLNNQIVLALKEIIDNLKARGAANAEVLRNVLKEELQFYVLNFIFHNPEYSNWTMYGGSSLRICHGLNRMSVDLDFEIAHKIDKSFLGKLGEGIAEYFKNVYGLDSELLDVKITTDRGLRLCFNIGDLVGINIHSKQVLVKIDLNFFTADKATVERVPVNRDQLAFVIKIYNLSSLMASKIAAILLRGQRGGADGVLYKEKGRDIYDLLWYMDKKIVPDLDYLKAKKVGVANLRELFDKLTVKMNEVNDTNLKNDLSPLFLDQTFIGDWLKNWRESYLRRLGDYKVNTITAWEGVVIDQDFSTENYSFTYRYRSENAGVVNIVCNLSDLWINYKDGDLLTPIDNKIDDLARFSEGAANGLSASRQKKLKQSATVFYWKIQKYLEKTNKVVLGDRIATKLIRLTVANLDRKEQIVLDNSALRSCELDDLLK